MSKEFAMVRRNVLQDACSFDDGVRLSAQHAIEALLAQPADQHQGEPVACAHEWTDDGEFNLTCTKCGKQENHEPYGWVQTRGPSINHFTQEWDVVQEWEDQGIEYKAMHDHADPGEVERLRDEIEQLHDEDLKWQGLREQEREIEGLRAKLAERDALLRRMVEYFTEPGMPDDLLSEFKALSASAEPRAPAYPQVRRVRAHKHTCANVQLGSTSEDICDCGAVIDGKAVEVDQSAPAEIDERAEYDKWVWSVGHGERGSLCAWMARAALERKP